MIFAFATTHTRVFFVKYSTRPMHHMFGNLLIQIRKLVWIGNFCTYKLIKFVRAGLQVIVIKRSSFPKRWTNAIASRYLRRISLGPPTKDPGNTTLFPTMLPLLSPANTLSTIPWYSSALISDCFCRK
ncbi:hypothetical protein RHMOL_Rhmol04G0146800 [Rhododendron molle]|uniref:Uncharacterized protein n=1 Tax=Rhododendron molle TaxID=49168 RepID=A0ACC0P0R6_RHOML|nr:hypothetical protein RHMOL_Rhmol04G0146800 [Rhododendron molle]